MSLRRTLEAARAKGGSVFIPFVMAGDPDLAASEEIILALEKSGAGVLELGVPFTDPVADGVTVQRAAERALKAGTTLARVLELVKRLRGRGLKMPVCLFSYVNPVYKMGYAKFAREAKQAGADGALIVDLPPEEAAEYCRAAAQEKLETVFLCSPTTSPDRLRLIDGCSTGFVYYVSREGVTGARDSLAASLAEKLANLKKSLASPLAVGFGISTPEHMRQLWGKADGIVVGSALVKLIEENAAAAAEPVGEKAKALANA
jgi:tryptophan synthase alpha chain